MRFILGLFVGLIIAIGIAAGGAYYLFGDLTDVGHRDKSNDITQSYDLMGFDSIDVSGVYEIDVTVGGDFSVEVSGPPDEMERVKVSVSEGELKLGQTRHTDARRKWRNRGFEAVVTLPALNAIDISGVIDGEVSGIAAQGFDADFSGVGSVELAGSCAHLRADVSGIGQFDASGLECETADVDVSGIGEASVFASREIDISVSGIGSVNVYGNPARVERDTSLFADISVR